MNAEKDEMSASATLPRSSKKSLSSLGGVGGLLATGTLGSLPRALDLKEAKKAFALKIAGSVPSGGSSPAKIVHAFIQVKDYEGLDRYLSKYTVDKDVLDFALQKASIASNAEAVDVLAKHGANVDFVDQFGTTALHFAMRGGGNPKVLLTLLKHGMKYSDWRSDGQSLLHWACQWGHQNIVSYLVEHRGADLHEYDDLGRLPIHIAATYGRPLVLGYLVHQLSHHLRPNFIPTLFLEALNDLNESDEDKNESSLTGRDSGGGGGGHDDAQTHTLEHHFIAGQSPADLARIAAAANYLDNTRRTPLHCASSEEAVNDYPQCMAILLEAGGDPMLRTVQGKTALDLAYEAGRAKVLIDIMPTEMMVELLMRINDVVPRAVRQERAAQQDSKWSSEVPSGPSDARLRSPTSTTAANARSRQFNSVIRRLTDGGKEPKPVGRAKVQDGVKVPESLNPVLVWRKILLNDDVELLETFRDSLIWCRSAPDYMKKKRELRGKAMHSSKQNRLSPADFETSQGLTSSQRAELFFDCYENGTGVYSHIQTNFATNLKTHDFLTILRTLTGLVVFEQFSVDGVVILAPLHTSILFLAVICGRFRIAEMLLRMRQFDLIPACVLVVLILHRLYQEPTFPEQVRSELQQFASHVEAIAVDVLTLVSLKDNTPEKEICRSMLNVPLCICGDLSLIDLFAQAKCTNLLSLPICQRVLDERWRGVLAHLPNWVSWTSRFCPLIALIHLERRARRERAKALVEFISEAAAYTGGQDSPIELTAISSDTKRTEGWQLASTARNSYGKKAPSESMSPLKRRRMAQSSTMTNLKNSNSLVMNRINRRPLTIYDRLASQYGWNGWPRLSFIKAIYTSPEVKFLFHSTFHILFLIVFTLVLLYRLHFQIHLTEYVAIAYVGAYFIEEVRQMIIETLRGEFRSYLRDSWNFLELTAVLSTFIGFGTRIHKMDDHASALNEVQETTFYLARVFYLFGLHLFCMRTLFITSISPIIGPRLKMMADMLRKDLVPLLIVFAIFILSYAVSFQGLMYPNSFYRRFADNGTYSMAQFPVGATMEKMFSRAFYSIFEVSVALEEAECSNAEICGNPLGNKLVILFGLIVYTGIVNLILINLLIALFSNTVSRIGQQSTAHWLADRYQMVKEYQDKSVLPPPLNILSIIFEVFSCYCQQAACLCCRRRNRGKHPPSGVGRHTPDTLDDLESQNADYCKEDLEVYHRLVNQKWNKKLRNSRRVLRLTHSRRNARWSKNSETEAVLQFVLVQSFALKDRRYTLGMTNATGSIVPQATSTSAAASSIEHRLQSLEKKLDTLLPTLLQEIRQLRASRKPPYSLDSQLSPDAIPECEQLRPCMSQPASDPTASADGLTTPAVARSASHEPPPTTSIGTQSFIDASTPQFIPAVPTLPRDLLSKRPVSHL
ncbi:hypothetical protein SprV_0401506300 [Sparganum proliferum]